MKAFRDIRVIPVVLVAIFGLAVLKIAGLIIDGGYVFSYQPSEPKQASWAQDMLNFPNGLKGDPADITGSTHGAPKKEEPPKPAAPAADPMRVSAAFNSSTVPSMRFSADFNRLSRISISRARCSSS